MRGLVSTLIMALLGAGLYSSLRADLKNPNREELEKLVRGWNSGPQELAQRLVEKYGLPDEATATRLIWRNNGPWKMTELSNEEVPHSFPLPHKDVLTQTINYRVPVDLFDDLAIYNGSVSADRTKGEMSSRCENEAMNLLTINLAHDVVTGKREVQKARIFHADTVDRFLDGRSSPYVEKLQFKIPANTEDSDELGLGEI